MKKKAVKKAKHTPAPQIEEFPYNVDHKRIMIGIVFLFSVILYFNTFNHQYTLDDKMAIYKNQFVMKGTDGISDLLKTDFFAGFFGKETNMVEGGRYRPLSLISFAIEYEMYGLSPRRSHVINTILYGLMCVLLFMVLSRLLLRFPYKKWYFSLPFITTLLFVSHPLHTEVVANIKGRDEIMSLGFALLTMLLVIRWMDKRKSNLLIIAFISFFLAMMSKENAAAFVAIIPIGLYLFKDHDVRRIIVGTLPVIGAFLLYFAIRSNVMGEAMDIKVKPELMNDPFLEMNGPEKYATIFYTLGLYLKLLIFPHPLTYDYYPYHIPIMDWGDPVVLFSFIVYFVMAIIAARYIVLMLKEFVLGTFKPTVLPGKISEIRGTTNPKTIYIFGLIIFVVTLLPTSNLFFPIGAFMNERFIFVGLLGFCLILTYLLLYKLPLVIKDKKTHYSAVSAFLLVVLILFSFKTIDRNKAWKDNLTLFSTDIETCPNSAKGNSSLGGEYLSMADAEADSLKRAEYIKTALPYFYKAVEIHPTYIESLIRLGKAYYDLEKNQDSLFHYFIRVIQIDPNNQDVHGNFRGIFGNYEDPDMKKIAPTRDVVKVSHQVYYNLGVLHGKLRNEPELAIKYFKKALTYNKEDFNTHKFLGLVYGINGNIDESIASLEKALSLNAGDFQVPLNLSISYNKKGDAEKSQYYFNKAVELNPALKQN